MFFLQISGTPSVAECRACQLQASGNVDWDAIEQKALALGIKDRTPKEIERSARKVRREYPPLPLHLSTLHLEAFIEARCSDFGVTKEQLLSRERFYTEIRYQTIFEAFVLGFPVDYLLNRFNCWSITHVIKNYCGDVRIQEVREKYGIGVYSRQVFRV